MKQNKLVKFNKLGELSLVNKYSGEVISTAINKFINGYITYKELGLGSFSMQQQVKHLISILENEKEIHEKNNESLDKICEILNEALRKDSTSEAERIEIYKLLGQISNIHRESQIKKSNHITSRIITAMGIGCSIAITLGTCLIHEKYKTQREKQL